MAQCRTSRRDDRLRCHAEEAKTTKRPCPTPPGRCSSTETWTRSGRSQAGSRRVTEQCSLTGLYENTRAGKSTGFHKCSYIPRDD
ncbi:unnamed protein product [Lampetra fluviatilis]